MGVSDDKKQELGLSVAVSPSPFSLYLLTQKDIYMRWHGGMEDKKEKKIKQPSLKGEKGENGEDMDKKWLIMKAKMGRWREKTSSYTGLTCHVNKWK